MANIRKHHIHDFIMVFLNLADYLEGKRSSKSENADEYKPFLPKTVIRYEIPETKPGYPWMEVSATTKTRFRLESVFLFSIQ